MDVDAQTKTMIDNLPARTGRSLEQWFAVLDAADVPTHGGAVAFLKQQHAMTHGFANLVVSLHRSRGQKPPSGDDLVDAQYAGRKSALRPILDAILREVSTFGTDVEVAPKKSGVSLRRTKQFALVEVPSARRVSLGVNLKGNEGTVRLRPVKGMCTHRVDLSTVEDVDAEVVGWIREAYNRA